MKVGNVDTRAMGEAFRIPLQFKTRTRVLYLGFLWEGVIISRWVFRPRVWSSASTRFSLGSRLVSSLANTIVGSEQTQELINI